MEDDLEAVECAVRRVLNQELDGGGENAGGKIELLHRLIEEVHAARARSRKESKASSDASENAAVKAAVAAANAAQAAADSVAKNSRMIELLLDTVRVSRRDHRRGAAAVDSTDDDDESLPERGDENEKEEKKLLRIVRNLQRQNVITHFILGFMVITTAIWRVKEITWILRVRKMLANPLETVGGIFGGDHHQEHHRKHKEEIEKPLQLPHLELPTLFHKSETTEDSISS
ncbi:hypothetical protein SELMODRAFT_443540 [Selaginella moellendorffii]|uniref:Uncharacterized protein n=1 Tax=Selaginella moellendorffii TaxID=88036 RepID=D8S236_SELML|nr:uncharacterized protein LOC9655783 [Selaginella moellendorffii]EFJ21396.1 hypothetical protein SELMODRAFT_443540 [Selaginella moellendorffii]|eukprot:XP_024538170.1 uncharacterized protein LOC9655783 [Selaginella moellendorffii]